MHLQKFAAAVILLFTGLTAAALAADRVPAAGGDIEITPFLHSSVQIEHAEGDPGRSWSLGDLSRASRRILVTDESRTTRVKAITSCASPGAPV